jgi:hypothetical protein
MLHRILLSTDGEGNMCGFCHRSIGNGTMKRPGLDSNDAVWNMLSRISDWPHAGLPHPDQPGDPTIAKANPYGDTTLQINDGATWVRIATLRRNRTEYRDAGLLRRTIYWYRVQTYNADGVSARSETVSATTR